MKDYEEFRYSAEQWDCIAAIITKMRGVNDVNRIPLTGGPSMRTWIEVTAAGYCDQGSLKRSAADDQTRLDNLIALRNDLQNRLIPTLAITTDVNTRNMLDATEAFIKVLTFKINLRMIPPVSIRNYDDEPAGNAAKTSRHRFWIELLTIWTEFGGKETGAATADFLIAASKPVGAGAKFETVLQWLKRRQRQNSRKIKPMQRAA